MATEGIKMMKLANPRLIYATFMDKVYHEYRQPIFDQNENLLVEKAHKLFTTQYSDIAYAFWIFDKHWKGMEEINKQKVWRYLRALILLAEATARDDSA